MATKCQYYFPIIVTMKGRQNKTVKLLFPHFFTYLWVEGYYYSSWELQVWHYKEVSSRTGRACLPIGEYSEHFETYMHLLWSLERFCNTENIKPVLRFLGRYKPLVYVLLVDMIWIRKFSALQTLCIISIFETVKYST